MGWKKLSPIKTHPGSWGGVGWWVPFGKRSLISGKWLITQQFRSWVFILRKSYLESPKGTRQVAGTALFMVAPN